MNNGRRAAWLMFVLAASTVRAQENADVLAKQLSNPVASLISVPLQYNVDFDIGSEDGTKQTLNIQPVIPASFSADWNLITRVIVPVIDQDDVFGDSGHQFGLGDTTPTFFFSPKKPTAGGWILGAGPVFLLPTATDELLGTDKWGIGPSALALKQTPTGWTYGALVNHIWSVAGDEDRADISSTFLQPFLAKAVSGRTHAHPEFRIDLRLEGRELDSARQSRLLKGHAHRRTDGELRRRRALLRRVARRGPGVGSALRRDVTVSRVIDDRSRAGIRNPRCDESDEEPTPMQRLTRCLLC